MSRRPPPHGAMPRSSPRCVRRKNPGARGLTRGLTPGCAARLGLGRAFRPLHAASSGRRGHSGAIRLQRAAPLSPGSPPPRRGAARPFGPPRPGHAGSAARSRAAPAAEGARGHPLPPPSRRAGPRSRRGRGLPAPTGGGAGSGAGQRGPAAGGTQLPGGETLDFSSPSLHPPPPPGQSPRAPQPPRGPPVPPHSRLQPRRGQRRGRPWAKRAAGAALPGGRAAGRAGLCPRRPRYPRCGGRRCPGSSRPAGCCRCRFWSVSRSCRRRQALPALTSARQPPIHSNHGGEEEEGEGEGRRRGEGRREGERRRTGGRRRRRGLVAGSSTEQKPQPLRVTPNYPPKMGERGLSPHTPSSRPLPPPRGPVPSAGPRRTAGARLRLPELSSSCGGVGARYPSRGAPRSPLGRVPTPGVQEGTPPPHCLRRTEHHCVRSPRPSRHSPARPGSRTAVQVLKVREAPRSGTARPGTARPGTTQHSTAQHSPAQHSPAQHSTAQPSIAQHSPAQPSPAQHSSSRHGAVRHRSRRAEQDHELSVGGGGRKGERGRGSLQRAGPGRAVRYRAVPSVPPRRSGRAGPCRAVPAASRP